MIIFESTMHAGSKCEGLATEGPASPATKEDHDADTSR